jgi:hypothetical protein
LDGPARELHSGARDQQDGLAIWKAKALVGDGNSVGLDVILLRRGCPIEWRENKQTGTANAH